MSIGQKPTHSKREDLQGIRGLAILSVLAFHFYPNYFPNGYLGVDQFFVLSGFLMCMLLTRSQKLPIFFIFTEFYTRRFKRILPLYFLFILVTVLALYTVFPLTAVYQNQLSAGKALVFLSNRPHTGDEDYFEKLSIAIDLFTHTWSLSVEIQFYCIVPFIFLIGHQFKGASKYGFYAVIAFISFIFHAFSPKTVSFNSVFARIWQFLIGMLVYFASKHHRFIPFAKKREEEQSEEKMRLMEENLESKSENHPDKTVNLFSKCIILSLMISVILLPYEIYPFFARLFFTVFTGAVMFLSVEDLILSSRVLIYFGDISYALYLVHWPIYAYVRLNYKGYPWILAGSLVLSVLLGAVVYETFEKWYLKQSNSTLFILILVLLILNGLLINKTEIEERMNRKDGLGEYVDESLKANNSKPVVRKFPRLDALTANMTFDDVERMNSYWNEHDHMAPELHEPGCVPRYEDHTWCDFKENGTEFKIAMLGNSYVGNHHKMLIQECKHRAHTIAMDDETGCEPLASNHAAVDNGGMSAEWSTTCGDKLNEFVDFISETKPDYAFILARFTAIGEPYTTNETDLEHDVIYLEMKKQVRRFLPNIKKKLFIIDSFPRVDNHKIESLSEMIKDGKQTMEEINKSLYNPSGFERGRRRHAELMAKECHSKCELIDYLDAFWNKTMNAFQYFDEKGFTYFTSGWHLSAHGLEHVRPIYRKICDNL